MVDSLHRLHVYGRLLRWIWRPPLAEQVVVIGSSVLMLTPFILYKIVFRDEEDMEELPEHMQARTSKEAFTEFLNKIWSKRKAIQEDIQKAWQDTSSESEDDKVDFSDW